MPWGQIIGWALKLLSYFLDPEVRERNHRAAILKKYRRLEEEHAIAWAEGAPRKASRIAKRLAELRERIRYVEAHT